MTMLSFFRTKTPGSKHHAGFGDPHSKRMDLEERKAYRREMLCQSIHETFLSLEVISGMYKFELVPMDARHHRFAVMIDVAHAFPTGQVAHSKNFAAMEVQMRSNAYQRFGIHIVAAYWRESEPGTQPERRARSANVKSSCGTQVTAHSASSDWIRTVSIQAPTTSRIGAPCSGQAQPVVHGRDFEYQTDLAPLDCGVVIGGTQYGSL